VSNEYSHDEVAQSLRDMVDQGLLEMGVDEAGNSLFWPTQRGAKVLGMEVAAEMSR